MALFANQIKLTDQLKDPLSTINQGAQDQLSAALGRIGTRQTASNKATGRVMGSYAPQQLAQAAQTASTGIEDTLRGALGNTSYSEYQKNLDQQRNLALAKEVGGLMQPSVYEQVLAGLGGGARAGGQFDALYNALNQSSRASGGSPTFSSNSRLSLIPGGSPSAYYQNTGAY